jgi:VanZ family protein
VRVINVSIQAFRAGFLIAFCAISYLALTPIDIPELQGTWDKSNHLIAFITLAFLLDFAVSGYWRKWSALAGYGVLIEVVQWFSGYRFFELSDILADCIGITIYIMLRAQCLKIGWLNNVRTAIDFPLPQQTLDPSS